MLFANGQNKDLGTSLLSYGLSEKSTALRIWAPDRVWAASQCRTVPSEAWIQGLSWACILEGVQRCGSEKAHSCAFVMLLCCFICRQWGFWPRAVSLEHSSLLRETVCLLIFLIESCYFCLLFFLISMFIIFIVWSWVSPVFTGKIKTWKIWRILWITATCS